MFDGPNPCRIVYDFAEETGVYGLNMFKRKRRSVETIFWLSVVFAFAACTARNLTNVTIAYLAEETVSSVSESDETKPFRFPIPELNFYIGPLGNIEEKEALVELEALASNNVSAFVEEVGENLARFTWKTLLEISALEHHLILTDGDEKPMNTSPALRKTMQIFREKSIDIGLLVDAFLLRFCNSVDLSISFKSRLKSYHAYNKTKLSSCTLGNVQSDLTTLHRIWISLGGESSKIDYVTPEDHLEVDIRFFGKHNLLPVYGDPWFFLESTQLGKDVNSFDHAFAVYMSDVVRRVHVRISVVYKFLNLRRRPCDESDTKAYNCRATCKIDYIVANYGCSPLRQRALAKELFANRSRDLPSACMGEVHNSSKIVSIDECLGGCSQLCERTVFSISTETTAEKSDTSRARTRIYLSTHAYTIVQEQRRVSFDTYLSDVGGALGLWLGLSFASVLHVPVFIAKTVALAIFENVKLRLKSSDSAKSLELRSHQTGVYRVAQ